MTKFEHTMTNQTDNRPSTASLARVTTTLSFNSREFRVRLWIDGVAQRAADYFCDDEADAQDTAAAMREHAATRLDAYVTASDADRAAAYAASASNAAQQRYREFVYSKASAEQIQAARDQHGGNVAINDDALVLETGDPKKYWAQSWVFVDESEDNTPTIDRRTK